MLRTNSTVANKIWGLENFLGPTLWSQKGGVRGGADDGCLMVRTR